MSENHIVISKTVKIGAKCRELFLPTNLDESFYRNGILLSGISELREEYSIYREKPCFALFLYTTAGKGVVNLCDKIELVTPGTLLFLPAGITHSYQIHGERWDIVWFHLLPETISNIPVFSGRKGVIFQMKVPRELVFLLRACIAHKANKKGVDEHFVLYAQMIRKVLLQEFYSAKSVVDMEVANRFALLLSEIYENPHYRWNIQTMAKKTSLSRGHFQRMFKKWCGETPMHKVLEARMQLAFQLLNSSGLSLERIAELTGYANQFALSKAFKRYYGMCPRAPFLRSPDT